MSQYKIEAKRTNELTDKEWQELTSAFNFVFRKELTLENFKFKYLGSSLGYSYHGFLYFSEQVVGLFSVIPRQYIYDKKEITIGLGCDAFIIKEHRKDEYFLKKMADKVVEKSNTDGVFHFISLPNKTAYPYWKYYGGWADIGKLNYYIVPLKISKLLNRFQYFDTFSFMFFKTVISLSTLVFSVLKNKKNKLIHIKRDQNFIEQRYSTDYVVCKSTGNDYYSYRIYNEDNIKTAYLVDCFPLSKSNIANAIKKIISDTQNKIDVILFIGRIDNPPFFLLKVPEKKEPRFQPFIGFSNSSTSNEIFFSIESWDVSLVNFDNR
jgi:hypothetical protein